jgi:hypothetical protein
MEISLFQQRHICAYRAAQCPHQCPCGEVIVLKEKEKKESDLSDRGSKEAVQAQRKTQTTHMFS